MKRKNIVLLAVLSALLGTIACSLFSQDISTSIPPEVLFEEREFTDAGCFFSDSTDEITYFVQDGAFHIDIHATEWYALSPCLGEENFTDFILDA